MYGCGGYGPGFHGTPWKSIYSDTYSKKDTLMMPAWFYGFHEHKFKYRYVDMDLPPDSVFQYFRSAIRHIPFVSQTDTVRYIQIEQKDYSPKQFYDDERLSVFLREHDIIPDTGKIVVPVLIYNYSAIWSNYGILHGGTTFTTTLNLWLLVFDEGNLVYRQYARFVDQQNHHEPEVYNFQLEQHHWDSLVQMGFKEYISRMK